jgi:hypothetical protein
VKLQNFFTKVSKENFTKLPNLGDIFTSETEEVSRLRMPHDLTRPEY